VAAARRSPRYAPSRLLATTFGRAPRSAGMMSGNHNQRLSRSAAGVLARRRTERRFRAPRPFLGDRPRRAKIIRLCAGRLAGSCCPFVLAAQRLRASLRPHDVSRMSSWATACIPVVNAVISTGAGTCELVRLRPCTGEGIPADTAESACTCQVRPSTMENGVAAGVVPTRSMSAAESRSRYSVRVPSRPPVTASISTSSVFDQCRWGLRRTDGFQNR
jgi:hypothetical protein